MPEISTAVSALKSGEVDWLENVYPDQLPLLTGDTNVKIGVTERPGSIGIMRFNHLIAPFDNAEIRRALLGAIDQADAMRAVAGTAPTYWRDFDRSSCGQSIGQPDGHRSYALPAITRRSEEISPPGISRGRVLSCSQRRVQDLSPRWRRWAWIN